MSISTLQSNLEFIKSLYFHEEWKDEKCRDEILEALEEANEKIEKAFGKSMCQLSYHKPSIEAVEKVANKFPSTLSYQVDGSLPIQLAAANTNGFPYIPVLAKEGIHYKVGGEDARGGLLMIDPYENRGWNTLQWLVGILGHGDNDAKRLDVIKELRKMGLLLKKDIQEYHLLRYTCDERCKERFEYLVDWDPNALIETRIENQPLTHLGFPSDNLFQFMRAGFEKHPNIGGLLFVKDDEGVNALDAIFNRFGTEKTMEMLHRIFSPQNNYPILHHVFVKAPEHIPTFLNKFPWATQLRDHHGRSLQQAVLAAGPDIMNANNFLFPMLTDDQIREKDAITTLYPFAAMAVGGNADLEKSFYLLCRCPSVLERRSISSSTITNAVTGKIRKRSDSV
ncbi:hypothetical protein CTEN210_00554 [Chaetoceros tenuissimus]|uniref:Uncharacterized protein n=1 Tax=Chaetoceros tenuissimus TaxID=426638 RepID=A0AAD3CFD2_9STRA|nr:hypothetical protein CTEN210_00554 [Chaetoceros tenuissimus]